MKKRHIDEIMNCRIALPKAFLSRKILSCMLFLVLTSVFVSAQNGDEQGLPFIQNYYPKTYGAETQNWAIDQDAQGVFYFGNNGGVLEYDGTSWRLTPSSNKSTIQSMKIDKDGTIYIGASNEFGYLKINNIGKFEYCSLSNQLHNIKFDVTWKICINQGGVYFFAGRKNIIRYHNSKLTKVNLPSDTMTMRGLQVNETIYVADVKLGLGFIDGDRVKLLNIGMEEAKSGIYSMLPITTDSIIVGTADNGLFLFVNGKTKSIAKINCDVNKYLIKNKLYAGVKLNDSTFVYSTIQGGIVFTDKKGKILQIINKTKGLSANGVYCLFIDKQKNLWAGLEKGVAQIWLNSPIGKFNEVNGLESTLAKISAYDGHVYVGTNNGLFYLPKKKDTKPEEVFGLKAVTRDFIYILDMCTISNKENTRKAMVVSSLRAVIQLVDSTKVNEIDKIYGGQTLCVSSKYSDRFFLGHKNGIRCYRANFQPNGSIKYVNEGATAGIDDDIAKIITDKNGDYWVGTAHQGLILMKPDQDENLKNFSTFKYDTLSGLPSINNNKPFLVNNKLFIATNNGMYSLTNASLQTQDPSKYQFRPDSSLGTNFRKDSTIVYYLVADKQNNVWMTTSKGFLKYDLTTRKSITIPFKSIMDIDKENTIFIEDDGTAWLGSPDAIYRYKQTNNKNYLSNFNVLIRKVSTSDSKVIYWGNGQYSDKTKELSTTFIEYPDKIKFDNNTITIEYSATSYENETNNRYKFFLEGYDEKWSEWTSNHEKTYTNLHDGTYKFKVVAKNIYETESSEAIFEFTVAPPFYRTVWAYVLYLIGAIVLYYLSAKINSRRLKKTNEKLEETVRMRTTEIEQQKEEIEAQSEQLMSQAESLMLTNNELKHLSLVAQDTDNSVAILNHKGAFEWWNKGFTRLFSYLFEKYNNSDFREFQRKLRPDLQKAIKEYSGNKESVVYTTHLIFDESHEIWFQTTLTPVYDDMGKIFRFVAIDSDITKIKLAEREIEHQKEEILAQAEKLLETNKELEKLSLVARETDNSIILIDPEGKIEWANEGFTRLFGYTNEELHSNPRLRADFKYAIDASSKSKRSYDYTSQIRAKDFHTFWIQTTLTPLLDDNDNIIRYIAIDSDITKIKQAEEEIRKQHYEIETQRDYIARQNQEITDSILYASRIQEAMLPPTLFIEAVLPQFFILNKPRNIVSGDFYWVAHRNDRTIFAVADSTGHGVPGAFMSMLGLTSLKEILTKKENLNANEILNELREWIIMSLHQSGKLGEANDGMDIAICIFNQRTNELQYAGANNSLFIVRSADLVQPSIGKRMIKDNYILTEIKADKMPIGIHYSPDYVSFTNNVLKIETGDSIYIFTDGYVDQFGGQLGRKFFTKQFKKLLISIQEYDMPTQRKILDDTIEKWKGDLEQVDDIMVMGVRI